MLHSYSAFGKWISWWTFRSFLRTKHLQHPSQRNLQIKNIKSSLNMVNGELLGFYYDFSSSSRSVHYFRYSCSSTDKSLVVPRTTTILFLMLNLVPSRNHKFMRFHRVSYYSYLRILNVKLTTTRISKNIFYSWPFPLF